MMILLSAAVQALASGPEASTGGSAPRLFDSKRLLTSTGTQGDSETLSLTPQFGVGYSTRERESRPGIDESVYAINAQAGCRLDMFNLVYLSAAAKLPVYTYDVTDRRLASISSRQERTAHQQYDLLQSPGDNLAWTGEMGLKLNPQLDFNFYYDQTKYCAMPSGTNTDQNEEKIGTRLIFHFK